LLLRMGIIDDDNDDDDDDDDDGDGDDIGKRASGLL